MVAMMVAELLSAQICKIQKLNKQNSVAANERAEQVQENTEAGRAGRATAIYEKDQSGDFGRNIF